jgi:predicted fused transcriptional regulator/phosphomethylpyrimidine kinase/predicted transcriptional regulator
MYPPCVTVIDNMLSDMRVRIAHTLKSSGLTQTEIAHYLHVSQAMVSKYLSRAVEGSEELDEVSSEVARMIIQGRNERDILLYVCQTCFKWRETGVICKLRGLEDCTVCTQLRSPDVLDEKRKTIQKVKEALSILESEPSIAKLMPEVRMNIAMSLKDASNPMEVAAIPGRLVPLHGRVTAVSDPEFGASHHLASILLKTGKKAVINIRYTDKIRSILAKIGISVTHSPEEPADVLVDEGGFGIEPCAYVFGKDAVDAALAVLRVAELL